MLPDELRQGVDTGHDTARVIAIANAYAKTFAHRHRGLQRIE
jgi:hypothetical protein